MWGGIAVVVGLVAGFVGKTYQIGKEVYKLGCDSQTHEPRPCPEDLFTSIGSR